MSKTEGWNPKVEPTPSDEEPARPAVAGAAPGTMVWGETEADVRPSDALAEAPTQLSAPRKAPLAADLVGAHLKHFRIDKRIASGGMGDVYLGFDTSLSRPVAIKTIRPQLARDETFLARFVREATAQANVVHPHVVQVYFVGEEQGLWFIAMQLVNGGSLHDVLDAGKKLRWQDAARHMRDICAGLCVAEQLQIVHRDIKPSNILLDRAGRALLSDFGLAAPTGAVERGTGAPTPPPSPSSATPSDSGFQLKTVTQFGVVLGTPEYVAPEQLRAAPIDSRADQYALAATFFHLIVGEPPLAARTLPQAIKAYEVDRHRAAKLRSKRRQVPRAFAAVIDRCLEVDPARRYPSMQALHDALEKAAPQPEVHASPALRALVWAIDVAPFLALTLMLRERMPYLPPALFLCAGLLGALRFGATPAIWLMRLRLRTVDDGDVSMLRGFIRFLLQHGWYLPASVGVYGLFASSDTYRLLVLAAAWFAVVACGSVGALTKNGQALHDWITRTRVLVDVRYR